MLNFSPLGSVCRRAGYVPNPFYGGMAFMGMPYSYGMSMFPASSIGHRVAQHEAAMRRWGGGGYFPAAKWAIEGLQNQAKYLSTIGWVGQGASEAGAAAEAANQAQANQTNARGRGNVDGNGGGSDRAGKADKKEDTPAEKLQKKLDSMKGQAISNIKDRGYSATEAEDIWNKLQDKINEDPNDENPDATLNKALNKLPRRDGMIEVNGKPPVKGDFGQQFATWYAQWIGGKSEPEAEGIARSSMGMPAMATKSPLNYMQLEKVGTNPNGQVVYKIKPGSAVGSKAEKFAKGAVKLHQDKQNNRWFIEDSKGKKREIKGAMKKAIDFDENTGIFSLAKKNYKWVARPEFAEGGVEEISKRVDKILGKSSPKQETEKPKEEKAAEKKAEVKEKKAAAKPKSKRKGKSSGKDKGKGGKVVAKDLKNEAKGRGYDTQDPRKANNEKKPVPEKTDKNPPKKPNGKASGNAKTKKKTKVATNTVRDLLNMAKVFSPV